jgi:glyoxylase-like metal-dependent hydrolase (beta-lactamase superfamily II)
MVKFQITFLLFFLIIVPILVKSQNICSDFIKKVKVSDRIITVGIGDAVSAILTKKGIVVIDAGESPSLTKEYMRIIKEDFKRNDIACLINTHSHLDHTNGNKIFDGINIIAHNNCITELQDYWKNPEKRKNIYQKTLDRINKKINSPETREIDKQDAIADKCRYTAVLDDFIKDPTFSLPNITFNDSMNLDMGDITLHLFYFGPAHTKSDIIIYVPEEKTVFIGDLFMPGGNPSFKIEDQKKAEQVYKFLNSFLLNDEIQTIISGHGDIIKKKELSYFKEELKSKFNLGQEEKNNEHELNDIEKTIRASIGWAKNKDFKLLYSVIANDSNYLEVQPGKKITRGFEEFKKGEKFWGNPNFKAIRYDIKDLKITISQNNAVAWFYCILDDINEWKGEPTNWENTRWTGVLEKRDGKWVIVQMHFSFSKE